MAAQQQPQKDAVNPQGQSQKSAQPEKMNPSGQTNFLKNSSSSKPEQRDQDVSANNRPTEQPSKTNRH